MFNKSLLLQFTTVHQTISQMNNPDNSSSKQPPCSPSGPTLNSPMYFQVVQMRFILSSIDQNQVMRHSEVVRQALQSLSKSLTNILSLDLKIRTLSGELFIKCL